MTIMEEDARRRAALAMQEEILRKVTRKPADCSGSVTGFPERGRQQRKGVGAGAEAPVPGQKIAGSSAAARAPEAAARPARNPTKVPPAPSPREAAAQVKTKPNRRENEFMLNLMILRNSLHTNAPACRQRAREAGRWVWRDIRLMTTLVDRIQEALLTTMPESRDEYYSAYARHGHYELRIDGPVRTSRHLLVTDRHLAAICEAAMKSECILCMREGSEIGRCELREALLEAAAPTDLQEGRWNKCEYREAAGQLVLGNDVTV